LFNRNVIQEISKNISQVVVQYWTRALFGFFWYSIPRPVGLIYKTGFS